MNSLKQPSFAPPTWAWSLIGLGYYAVVFFSMYRLSGLSPRPRLALALLVLVVVANAFWNYGYFRRRDLRLVFWYSAGYALLSVGLLVSLFAVDKASGIAFSIYVAYLPYALTLFYRTWKMNAGGKLLQS